MGSRNSVDDSVSIPAEHDIATLRSAQAQTRSVLDHQIQNFADIDDTAAKTFRLDAILLGLLLTAVSFVVRTDVVAIESYLNPLMVFSVICLIGSFVAAVVTYTTTGIETGIGPADVERLIDRRYTETEWLVLLLRSEGKWIRANERANRAAVRYLWISHGALIVAVVTAFVGIAWVHLPP